MKFASLATVIAVAVMNLAALGSEDKATAATALKAARLFDGKSDGLMKDGVVLVEGDKIVAAGTKLPIPAGVTVIDLGDATISAGFMDAHTHLTYERIDDWN